MRFCDFRSRSTRNFTLVFFTYQARRKIASCSIPTLSADTTMTSSRPFLLLSVLSFFSTSRCPRSSFRPSCFFLVISAISSRIRAMRASISSSRARCRSTLSGKGP